MSDVIPPKPPNLPKKQEYVPAESGRAKAGKKKGFFSTLFSKDDASPETESEPGNPNENAFPDESQEPNVDFELPSFGDTNKEQAEPNLGSEPKGLSEEELKELRSALGMGEEENPAAPAASPFMEETAKEQPQGESQPVKEDDWTGKLPESPLPEQKFENDEFLSPVEERPVVKQQKQPKKKKSKQKQKKEVAESAPKTDVEQKMALARKEMDNAMEDLKKNVKKRQQGKKQKKTPAQEKPKVQPEKKKSVEEPSKREISALQRKKESLEKQIVKLQEKKEKATQSYKEKDKKLKESIESQKKVVQQLKNEQKQLRNSIKGDEDAKLKIGKDVTKLKQEKEELQGEVARYKKEFADLKAQTAAEKEKLAKEQKKFSETKKKLDEKTRKSGKDLEELQKKSEELLSNLRQKENVLHEKEKSIQTLIEQQKRIQAYLEEKSVNMHEASAPKEQDTALDETDFLGEQGHEEPRPSDDNPFNQPILDETPVPESPDDLQQKIDDCKELIAEKDISDAKLLYNELRNEFAGMSLSQEQKKKFYKELRELYEEIRLSQFR